MSGEEVGLPPVKLFCSYSHADADLREALEKHLIPMREEGLITVWHDRKIEPGAVRDDAVTKELESADIILLLLSADFMNSEYSAGTEMKRALARADAREALVVPILLRPFDWKHLRVAKRQALPSNHKPVTIWANQDEAWLDVAVGLRAIVERVHRSFSPDGTRTPIEAPRPRPRARLPWMIAAGTLAVAAAVGLAAARAYRARVTEGERYLDIGRPAEADAAFARALGLLRFGADALAGREKARLWSGDGLDGVAFDRAVAKLERERPSDPQVMVLRGNILFARGDAQAASARYQAALRLAPELAEAYFGLGICEERLGHRADAAKMYEHAVQISQQTPRYLGNLASLHAEQGDLDRAIGEYRAITTEYPLGNVELARLLWAKGDLAGARGEQLDALAGLANPKIQEAVENRGRWGLYARAGEVTVPAEIGGLREKACYVRLELSVTSFLQQKQAQAHGEIEQALRDCAGSAAELASMVTADVDWLIRQPGLDARIAGPAGDYTQALSLALKQ
jgi:tetratricopeptide (TPR) repeat protein